MERKVIRGEKGSYYVFVKTVPDRVSLREEFRKHKAPPVWVVVAAFIKALQEQGKLERTGWFCQPGGKF